ncbi:MAG: hypothetical protein GY725_24935 [bacterium]|nr:hypothetical protein [bacterium]
MRAYADETGSCLNTDHPGQYGRGVADGDFVRIKHLVAFLNEWNSPVIKTPGIGISEALCNLLACAGILAEAQAEKASAGTSGTAAILGAAFQKLGLQGMAETFVSPEGKELLRTAEDLMKNRCKSLTRSDAETHARTIVTFFKAHKEKIASSGGRLAIATSRLYLGAMSSLELATELGNPKKWAAQVPETAIESKSLAAWKNNPKNEDLMRRFIAAAFTERAARDTTRSSSSNAAGAALSFGTAHVAEAEDSDTSAEVGTPKPARRGRKHARETEDSDAPAEVATPKPARRGRKRAQSSSSSPASSSSSSGSSSTSSPSERRKRPKKRSKSRARSTKKKKAKKAPKQKERSPAKADAPTEKKTPEGDEPKNVERNAEEPAGNEEDKENPAAVAKTGDEKSEAEDAKTKDGTADAGVDPKPRSGKSVEPKQ